MQKGTVSCNVDFEHHCKRWVTGLPPLRTSKPKSNLSFAGIVSKCLYQSLLGEAKIGLLTPKNWRSILKHTNPQFLLIESCWETATGHWFMAQTASDDEWMGLGEIIGHCKKNGIPTVFWITQDVAYYSSYEKFAFQFDFIFCADYKVLDSLNQLELRANFLLPGIQPAIFNPIKHYDYYDKIKIGALLDGWSDVDRFKDNYSCLQELTKSGLLVIDSKNTIFKTRLHLLGSLQKNVGGICTEQERIITLKYSSCYLSMEPTSKTPITRLRMDMEAMACRTPIVFRGSLDANDVRKNYVGEFNDDIGFLKEIARHQHDRLYREQVAQKAWREINSKHTIAHRLLTICKVLGVKYNWVEFPLVSIISPTFRKDYLGKCIEQFDRQSYPEKELILIYNEDDRPRLPLGVEDRDDIRFFCIPKELFTGACMNLGTQAANGKYCFKMDDDDHYGNNYILDMMLHARAIDADVLGKPLTRYLHFERDNTVYRSISKNRQLTISPWNHPDFKVPSWFVGCSISGKTEVLLDNKYTSNGYRCSDSSFFLNTSLKDKNALVVDELNMVVERRQDVNSHTWEIDEDSLKNKAEFICSGIENLFV